MLIYFSSLHIFEICTIIILITFADQGRNVGDVSTLDGIGGGSGHGSGTGNSSSGGSQQIQLWQFLLELLTEPKVSFFFFKFCLDEHVILYVLDK